MEGRKTLRRPRDARTLRLAETQPRVSVRVVSALAPISRLPFKRWGGTPELDPAALALLVSQTRPQQRRARRAVTCPRTTHRSAAMSLAVTIWAL
jgi:hypothetical protein